MIKVLQVGFGYKVGGIQNCLLNFCKNIDHNLIKFDFVNMTEHKLYYEEDIKLLGSTIYDIPNEQTHPIKCYKQLKKLIIDNKYDIVHINKNSLACMVAIKAVKDSRVKVKIIHSHSTKSNGGRIANLLHKFNKQFISKYCDYYFACSNEAANWMFTDKILKSDKFYFINNAIDLSKFKYDKNKRMEIRKKLGLSENVVIGHVGRFVEVKNHKFLIDLLKRLLETNSNYKLMLVGDGELYDEIVSYSKEQGIYENVCFLGNRRDTFDLYQAMDIFVLPSLHEGLPIVGVEAQAAGVPSIFSTNVTKDVKLLDTTVFIDLDIDQWILQIERYCKLNIREKCNNDKIIQSNFNIEKEAKKLENLYLEFFKLNK